MWTKKRLPRSFFLGVLTGATLVITCFQLYRCLDRGIAISITAEDGRSFLPPPLLRKNNNELQVVDETTTTTTTTGAVDAPLLVTALIPDGASIRMEILTTLVQLSCLYGARVTHVMVAENAQTLRTLFDKVRQDLYRPDVNTNSITTCSPFIVEMQPTFPDGVDLRRVERLAFLRDFQRDRLRDYWIQQQQRNNNNSHTAAATFNINHNDGVVVLNIDLDLLEVPPAFQIQETARRIVQQKDDFLLRGNNNSARNTNALDVICAGGLIVNDRNGREGYYDSFATIFEPDTYMMASSRRWNNTGQNKSLTLDENNGKKHYEIWEWMLTQPDGVPARSCFGGMALYRASFFLDERCSYSVAAPNVNISEYELDRLGVCEHIVFNTCLHSRLGAQMAILPGLRTRWTPNEGLRVPTDLNLASKKFQLGGIDSRGTQKNSTTDDSSGDFIWEQQRVKAGVLSLTQMKKPPSMKKGNALVVLKPGPSFGKVVTVLHVSSDFVHVMVGNDIMPFSFDDLALIEPDPPT